MFVGMQTVRPYDKLAPFFSRPPQFLSAPCHFMFGALKIARSDLLSLGIGLPVQ